MGYPVIFVHGIGASASVWRKFDIPAHRAFHLSFSSHFSSPPKQVAELARFIDDVLRQTGEEKVILVCHSMGGLVARNYLAGAEHPLKVVKLVLLSVPNLGVPGLRFNWAPAALIVIGFLGYQYVWPLLLCMLGALIELASLSRHVLLLSPGAWAMRPGSRFFRQLNTIRMPTGVKYVAVLSDTRYLPHRLVNVLLFREGGDGAVPLSSQKLSQKCVPNFSGLDYSELMTDLPHFRQPKRAQVEITKAVEMG